MQSPGKPAYGRYVIVQMDNGDDPLNLQEVISFGFAPTTTTTTTTTRMAEVGSLSSGAKMVIKTLVKRVFTIFPTNASFLRVIASLPI